MFLLDLYSELLFFQGEGDMEDVICNEAYDKLLIWSLIRSWKISRNVMLVWTLKVEAIA